MLHKGVENKLVR